MSVNYILTGRPLGGKSALAAWLCSRLPRPAAGVRTVCIGRCEAGPLFGLQDLTTGRVEPVNRAEGRGIESLPAAFESFGCRALQAARDSAAPTVLVDELGCWEGACPGYLAALNALLDGPATVVAIAAKEDRPHLNALRARQGDVQIDLDDTTPEAVRAALAPALPAPLHPGVSVRLYGAEKCFGPGPMELLERVGRTGSLHKAAAAMGMAYSKAWKLLGALEQQWGFAILQRSPGGAGGGGSLLTPAAWDLLERYRALQWETARAADQAFARHFADFVPAPGTEDKQNV